MRWICFIGSSDCACDIGNICLGKQSLRGPKTPWRYTWNEKCYCLTENSCKCCLLEHSGNVNVLVHILVTLNHQTEESK